MSPHSTTYLAELMPSGMGAKASALPATCGRVMTYSPHLLWVTRDVDVRHTYPNHAGAA